MIAVAALITSCVKYHCKCRSTFSVLLNDQTWRGEPDVCDADNSGTYNISILEKTSKDIAPDKLAFVGLSKHVATKRFLSQEDVETEPRAVFSIYEEFDGAIDHYYIIPDGESWLRIASIDPDSDEWTIDFHLKMLVGRENGPLNVTYGDTITFSQGEMKAVFRKG